MRKQYIDNLRILCILLLVPFHSARIFNGYESAFYLRGQDSRLISLVVMLLSAWWMQLLFVLAGMSTKYAFAKRTSGQYAKERCLKLLVPFVFSMILVVPAQSYIADLYYNGYQGSYFQHFREFLTVSDFSGYDGHFTPGHCWFIQFLFLVSMLLLPVLEFSRRKNLQVNDRFWIPAVAVSLAAITLTWPVFSLGGKSLVQFAVCFLAGFYVFSSDRIQEKLEKLWPVFGVVLAVVFAVRASISLLRPDLEAQTVWLKNIYQVAGIAGAISLGKRFLDKKWEFTGKFAKSEFSFYIIHQSVVVIVGYYVLKSGWNNIGEFLAITVISYIVTALLCAACRFCPVTRFMFAIKK